MAIRAIIFDVGGVLLRTEDDTERELLAQRLGLERAVLEKLAFGGESGLAAQRGEIDIEQHWENVRQALGLSAEGIKDFVDAFFAGDNLDRELVDKIRELRKDYKTALLSNAFSNLRHYVDQVWEIKDAFDELIISSEEGVMKPDEAIYRIALQRLGVAPHEAVFVDDFTHNVEGAREVGLHAIHFQNPDQTLIDLEQVLKES
jgi:epoxide hydrolase-like predicted phosphatase